ncbi:hypothetical protein VSS86_23335, partial [Bacillus safensis]|uniref:hypothetical protein n=1 Tax=Bacillus safensis TaxID=561879 RepID=UPI002DD422F8
RLAGPTALTTHDCRHVATEACTSYNPTSAQNAMWAWQYARQTIIVAEVLMSKVSVLADF